MIDLNPIKDVAAELAKLRSDEKTLRRFSLTIAIAFAAIGTAVHIWGAKNAAPWLWSLAGALTACGLFLPGRLVPVYKVWMGMAFFLGWFVSRMILGIVFYLAITPIGLILRLLGKRLLTKADAHASTYWVRRDGKERSREAYEKLF